MGALIFGILAGVLAIGTAIIQYYSKIREERKGKQLELEAAEFRQKFEREQAKTILLLEEQNSSIKNVQIANEKLITAQEENQKLQNELLKYTTGGDSYCYITLDSRTDEPNALYITCINSGKYPIKDVTAQIVDQDNIDFSYQSIFDNVLKFGNIGANSAIATSEKIHFTNADKMIRLLVRFSTENAHFNQQIRIMNVNGLLCRAIQVRRFSIENQDILLERRDDCFKGYKDLFE